MNILKPAFSTDLGSVYNADCIDLLALFFEATLDPGLHSCGVDVAAFVPRMQTGRFLR